MPKYDPVPPYDLDDIEATAQSQQPVPSSSRDESSQQEQTNESNVVHPLNHRPGKLTERECCEYAFMYFKTCILALVLVTFIIALFNYMGRRK